MAIQEKYQLLSISTAWSVLMALYTAVNLGSGWEPHWAATYLHHADSNWLLSLILFYLVILRLFYRDSNFECSLNRPKWKLSYFLCSILAQFNYVTDMVSTCSTLEFAKYFSRWFCKISNLNDSTKLAVHWEAFFFHHVFTLARFICAAYHSDLDMICRA